MFCFRTSAFSAFINSTGWKGDGWLSVIGHRQQPLPLRSLTLSGRSHQLRQRGAYDAKRFMEDWMPLTVEVLIEGVPKEGERLTISVFGPVVPSVGERVRFESEEVPSGGWGTNGPHAQQHRSYREAEATFLEKLTACSNLRLLTLNQRSFHELVACKQMPKG